MRLSRVRMKGYQQRRSLNSLFIIHKRRCQWAAALDQVSLNLNLLIGIGLDARLEGIVARKGNLDPMGSWCHEQPAPHPLKLAYMSHVEAIHKHRGPRGIDCDFDCGRHRGERWRYGFCHAHTHDLGLSGLDLNLSFEVLVAILAHDDFVFTRQKQNLF